MNYLGSIGRVVLVGSEDAEFLKYAVALIQDYSKALQWDCVPMIKAGPNFITTAKHKHLLSLKSLP